MASPDKESIANTVKADVDSNIRTRKYIYDASGNRHVRAPQEDTDGWDEEKDPDDAPF